MSNASLQSRAGGKKGNIALRRLSASVPLRARKSKAAAAKTEVYWLERTPVDFYPFDEEYLRRLGAHDPATEAHFHAYFSERLKITLRARGVDVSTIEDVRQETFCRVWDAILSGSVNNPQGFGAYVHTVCRNVLSERRREDSRNKHDSLESNDVPDEKRSLQEQIELREDGQLVRTLLDELPERDRHLLLARFFEDRDNEEVCGDFGVDRDYLRVLFHRAINRFGDLYRKRNN